MEFRLKYDGKLKSRGNVKHKHMIREKFHPQLKELWKIPPLIHEQKYLKDPKKKGIFSNVVGNFDFVYVVGKQIGVEAELDILMLVPSSKGQIVHKGDIDNRLKTLFDALRCPHNIDEIPSGKFPTQNQKPFFYCLLEDDSLIKSVKVTYDRWLSPYANETSVSLIIQVRIKKVDSKWYAMFVGS